MGLSAADKKNVQDSWAAVSKDWEAKNGFNFYTQMFKNNPEIAQAFNNADLQAQSTLFGVMVSSWISGLDNDAAFKSAMNGFCKSHKGRGVTNMTLFDAALTELASFIKSTTGLSGAQEASWGLVKTVILDTMKAGFASC